MFTAAVFALWPVKVARATLPPVLSCSFSTWYPWSFSPALSYNCLWQSLGSGATSLSSLAATFTRVTFSLRAAQHYYYFCLLVFLCPRGNLRCLQQCGRATIINITTCMALRSRASSLFSLLRYAPRPYRIIYSPRRLRCYGCPHHRPYSQPPYCCCLTAATGAAAVI